MSKLNANSEDPGQTPRSDLGHSLLMSFLWDARLKWVNMEMPHVISSPKVSVNRRENKTDFKCYRINLYCKGTNISEANQELPRKNHNDVTEPSRSTKRRRDNEQ